VSARLARRLAPESVALVGCPWDLARPDVVWVGAPGAQVREVPVERAVPRCADTGGRGIE